MLRIRARLQEAAVILAAWVEAREGQGQAEAVGIADICSRYRKSWEQPTLLQAGEIVEVVIEPFASCNIFKRGHRLRLDIAGSNFPHFDCNPNSGEPEGQGRGKRVATNRVHVGGIHASYLEIRRLPL